jgi:hypothetical protein
MKAQLDNILMSSMMLWMDNKILSKGQAFTNFSSNFYSVPNLINGFYSYGLPFKQIVCDNSINGANLLSGVYVNNNYTNIGTNNLTGINPNQGQAYFSSAQNGSISGNYAVKDFNIYITSNPEENILFETEYRVKPKTNQNPTGLAPNALTYPAIFLKLNNSTNIPFAFGGMDRTNIDIRAIILAENTFSLDAVSSILRDTARSYVPVIENQPFNSFGGLDNGYFNYNSLSANSDMFFYIKDVSISKISYPADKTNYSIYPGIVDFTLENIRHPLR